MGSASSYTVDEKWMDRVQEVVDYCIDNDLYVVLNTHHDDWIVPTNSKKSEVEPKLKKLWTQIATRFKNYDDKLIFETLNEPRVKGSAEEWSGGTKMCIRDRYKRVFGLYFSICSSRINFNFF